MDDLIKFFALRPLFTFRGLKVVWYLYLFHILIQPTCHSQKYLWFWRKKAYPGSLGRPTPYR